MSNRSTYIGLIAALVVFGAVAPMPVAAADLTIDGVDVPNSVTTDESFSIEVDVSEQDTSDINVVLGLPTQLSCSPSGSQSVSTDGGSGTATFSCEADVAGDYSGQIDVAATGSPTDGSSDSISDSAQTGLVVRSPASLSLTTSLDSSTITEGSSTTLTASVSNTGDDATSYTLSAAGGSGLSTSVASGSASDTIDGGDTVFVSYSVDGDSAGDHDATITLTGGNGQDITATETITVQSSSGDDGSDTTTSSLSSDTEEEPVENETTTNETTDEEIEDGTPNATRNRTTVTEVRSELNKSEPDTQTNTTIVDNDPDRPGVNINPNGTESVREITFDNESASGTVEISEYQAPPESVSQSVTEAVTDSGGTDSGETTASVATVADISPDSPDVSEASATVTMSVDRAKLDDPANAVVVHERDDSWEELNTTVQETSDGEVTLEAQTESFSLFAVAEVEETTQNETETNATDVTDDSDAADETSDGIPGFGLTVALAALIAAAMLAQRRID